MDWIDWLLGIGMVALVSVALGLLWPPYGYPVGALVGGLLAWRALRQRKRLLEEHKKEEEKK